jgi:flagellar hook-associated protein 1 FlgK
MASALMSLGVRAMFASFAQLQVTGQNIANAGVDGYSRQQAELATANGQFTGAGFFGKGVDVVTVSRAHDAFLTREAANASALAAMDRTRFEQLTRLEEVFPMGERGLGYAAQQFLNAMVDLASRPQDPSTREVVLARAGDLAARFNVAARQLDSLQAGVTQDLKHSVDTVNQIAQRIADVNQQIAMVKGLGQPPNDLLDQRDRLVQQLSGYLQVSTIPADDGTLGVFIAGGQRLVLGNQAQPLQVVPDPLDASRSALGIVEAGGVRPLTADLLTGGSITALLRFQNDDLVAARESIDRMAAAFADGVNAQHALGLDLEGRPGIDVFAYGGSVAGAAGAIRLNITDPRHIAAASPLTATLGVGNVGTAGVASLTMTAPLASGNAVQITFGAVVPATPPATAGGVAYTWTRGATSGTGTWTPGQPLAIGEFALQLTGVPAENDQILVMATKPADVGSNNGNARALAALRDAAIVDGQTITDAYASAMAGVGVRVQGARTAAEISASVAASAEQQRAAKSGVNLDEEAARLIQFQQAYQAAAKVLQVAQSVFDTLLSTAAR